MIRQSRLVVIPVTFAEACEFILAHHRTRQPPRGHKWSFGIVDDQDRLVGVGMIGRPVARHFDDGFTLEVNRAATDGSDNVNSCIYGAAWRAAKAMGYRRIVTYTEAGESGVSLRAAGYRVVAQRPGRSGWTTPSRPREDRGADRMPRTLWEAS